MQHGNRDPDSASRLVDVRAKMASGYYLAPNVALKTAELILKNHPRLFEDGRRQEDKKTRR